MAIVFKTPDDIATEYLTNLKILKPNVNIDQVDSDWFVRGKTLGGVGSGIYADQQRIADDAFPQSARHDALDRHLFVYFNGTFNPAQQSQGNVFMTAATGSFMAAGTQMVYAPNSNAYQTTQDVTFDQPTASVPVTSINAGALQNLLPGAVLSLSSPPAGVGNSATALFPGLADGTDAESDQAAATRILNRIRFPVAGGTKTDYEQFAIAADPAVTSATVFRYIFGLGTVGIVITSGTTDIDAAIDSGSPIIRTPSDALVAVVQQYIESVNPLTDCAHVLKPNEVSQDVTFKVNYAAGFNGSSILAGQTLTLNQLVQREIGRTLYKMPIGGRQLGASGYVLASEIEEGVDIALSGEAYVTGSIAKIIIDRQCDNLAATSTNRLCARDEIFKPGVLTIVEGFT
jgi:uncharacterized phage protein gp47/JayE